MKKQNKINLKLVYNVDDLRLAIPDDEILPMPQIITAPIALPSGRNVRPSHIPLHIYYAERLYNDIVNKR